MCGISGAFGQHLTDNDFNIVDDIMQSQAPRGPDYQALQKILGDQVNVLFAHNRLSIIDLSENAHQPMWDITQRYCIVYNGEIYNYLELKNELIAKGFQFKTTSDTEVILNAFACWGVDALSRMYGPFAFALYDKSNAELWLCRDRFGVRPLFYAVKQHTMYFASSTRELAKHLQLQPNMDYLARGLNYLVFENGSEETQYNDLYSVKPSHYLKINLNAQGLLQLVEKSYYDLEVNVAGKIADIGTQKNAVFLDSLEQHFYNAVDIRLRSDVPIAISLSSGLDSTSIAALVSRKNTNTIGFSYGHPNHAHTEGPLVAKCADFLDITMKYVQPSAQEMVEGLFKTIALQDAPFSSLSVVAQALLYQSVQQHGVKVLLGGQGGDEALMGYRKFFMFNLQNLLRQKKYISASKNSFALLPMIFSELSQWNLYWRQRRRYLGEKGLTSMLDLPQTSTMTLTNTQVLWKRQMLDITKYSLPTLLRYEDRNGMGHGVESRLPFLDHRIIELGLAMPVALKIRHGFGKWPLRHIMKNKIPNQIRMARYKRGFDISMEKLLAAGLGNSVRAVLQDKHHQIKHYLKGNNKISDIYSDQQLLSRSNAMTEVIALLWLSSVNV